ncbi:LysR family transcriptional regulator [Rubrobacter marinus]|uniref:LysR family transcriptional regulator n=1 Tax=Rubrobacter marinus TaxID=2653852 RepID=A0A6G8Q0G3_9ACTN|nr:LysR family transcriptional regulator [Rubrobacter marinus]QIN79961.1 LysR family transcriptional regulator [Rubrobacter marinus]
MELSHLRYFVAVAEELHFGRAARRMHKTQPALSKQVSRLEKELGIELLHRANRKVRLTDAGRVFFEEACRVLEDVGHATEAARRAAEGEIGALEVGFFSPAIYGILPEIIKTYRDRFPDVKVTLHEWTSAAQVERLREGKIEVGFMRAPVDDEELITEHVFHEPVVAALPENHPLANWDTIPPEKLANEPFIMVPRRKEPSSFDKYVGICQRVGFSPRVVQEVFEIHAIVGLVATGMGVAFVPASIQVFQRPGVVYRALQDQGAQIGTAIVRRNADPPPVLRMFISILRKAVTDLSQRSGK